MALKGIPPKQAAQTAIAPTGNSQTLPDYSSMVGHNQLVAKPILSSESIQKTIKGEPVAGAPQGETVTQHPGVFTSKPGMSVMVEGGRTINLGNFESARISVSITVPCDPESLNDAYEWGTDWISARIEAAVKEAKGL